MYRYYVTLGLADMEPKTYGTNDRDLAMKYCTDYDNFTEVLDTQEAKILMVGPEDNIIEVPLKELPPVPEQPAESAADQEPTE